MKRLILIGLLALAATAGIGGGLGSHASRA